MNSSNQLVAKYAYDAWGNCTVTPLVADTAGHSITDANHIAHINPFRYRGYYYDTETGLYYLNSRYYDPQTGRFLNADALLGANGDILSYNLFAYCSNNPVMYSDPTGHGFFDWVKDKWEETKKNVSDAWNSAKGAVGNAYNKVKKTATDVYDYVTNDSEQVVLNAKHVAFYKGKLVIKLPIGTNAASFGVIFLGDDVANRSDAIDTVKHEYGHAVQFDRMGIIDYTTKVAIPSVTCNLLDRANKLPYDYYSSPWEYGADRNGGVNRGNYEPWADTVNNVYNAITSIFRVPFFA